MFFLIIVLPILILPIVAAVTIIWNMFREKAVMEKTSYWITYIWTGIFFWGISNEAEYDIALISDGVSSAIHTPISKQYVFPIITLYILFFISHFIITQIKNRVPPLIMASCSALIFAGIVLNCGMIIQLYKNKGNISDGVPYYILIIFNNVLISIPAVEKIVYYCTNEIDKKYIESKNRVMIFLYSFVSDSIRWYMFIFIIFIPLLIIFSIVLILFGHSPDAVIKAFTETSDWTFSQRESPPAVLIEQNGHYLFTVAANGHEKIVKPVRMRIRDNSKIVVNRQLCIANAFEQLIEERVPKIHRVIRKNYDRYGYPLSKHINTKFQADIVYIFMKPMEWLFLICLYTFDIKPENRIAIQYTGKKQEDIIR